MPTKNPDSGIKFASERSHRISQQANEHARATSQACLLINGGAATALIAFLAKDKVDPDLLKSLPYALACFAFGVISSAVMMYSMAQNLECWNEYWLAIRSNRSAKKEQKNADWWWSAYKSCFLITIGLFALGCVVFAASIWKS